LTRGSGINKRRQKGHLFCFGIKTLPRAKLTARITVIGREAYVIARRRKWIPTEKQLGKAKKKTTEKNKEKAISYLLKNQ
jgi:hypothetical protein